MRSSSSSSSRLFWVALACALSGFALLALGVVLDVRRAALAYLAAFAFAVSVALGALVTLMIDHVSGASWTLALRRIVEAVALALVPLAALFVPVVLAAGWIYPWAHPDPALARELADRRGWFSVPGFAVRSALYFAVFLVVVLALRRLSTAQRGARSIARARMLAGGALPAVGLAITFASFDWTMSLEPGWISSVYGLYFFADGFLGAVAVVAVAAFVARRNGWLPPEVGESHFHALGRVMLAATALWAYLAFSQFFLVWIADVPSEVVWYRSRLFGGWRPLAILLAVGRFGVPFFALLQRAVTRHAERLAVVGSWQIAMTFVDVYWLVMPSHLRAGPRVHWLDLAALAAVAGTVVAFGASRITAAAALPRNDPRVATALEYQSS